MNDAPSGLVYPGTFDKRMTTDDPQCLHAQHAAVKPKLIHSGVGTCWAIVGVPFGATRGTPVVSCTCLVTNVTDVSDKLDYSEVFRIFGHLVSHLRCQGRRYPLERLSELHLDEFTWVESECVTNPSPGL